VGLIKFAYKNAKIQGREIGAPVVEEQVFEEEFVPAAKPQQQQAQPQQSNEKPKKKNDQNLMKKFFGYFFD
ncbi:hypothetical protein KZ287_26615, partial [Escherichia coli]|nr:hypothetical protein [Escherichia coli]